ncbi:hypothetical protein PYS58_14110 [Chryseobacterium indologenes]|uniref:hypothetical protein n=1 Tax=Chryseobacterium indologenes TaxID=253 RepID=UPI0023E7DEA3|nr:hypothetical protein [Chryseobacterium indologenes]WET47709.1 hypothetical protein PYS58_14110 [Chryseobacterium indologenes]
MEYTKAMKDSLQAVKTFLTTVSDDELNEMIEKYGNMKVRHCEWFYHYQTLAEYLTEIYSKHQLFEEYKDQERKSVLLTNKLKKDLNKGPFIILN